MLRLGQVRAVPTRQSMGPVSTCHLFGRPLASPQFSIVRPFGIKPPIRHTIVTSCVSGVFDLCFLELARLLVVLGVSVLVRTRIRLFAEVVTIVVIWLNQIADTVVPPLTQLFGNTRERNKEVQM